MRSLLVIGAGAMLASASGVAAQPQQRVITRGPGAGYARPGPQVVPHMPNRTVIVRRGHGNRWGSHVGGRWWGGVNAPGGWNAYRRQTRGYVLPSYWIAPRFIVNDWRLYGLTQPTAGYRWVRYYDDAVMVDDRGSVFDSVQGVDWDGGYAQDDRAYDERVMRDERRGSDGAGGAVAGAVVGGVAGNVIAGRGSRLGGTLLGAGVGAAAGYAIDRAEDRRRRERDDDVPVAPDYAPGPGAGHDGPVQHHYVPAPMAGGPGWTSPDGRTTVVTHGGGYPGSTVTTVTVQNAPVITTTTTTETWEDHVTYTRKPARKAARRTWRPKTKCVCR
jgi:Ni/Co efflux regulator RcnB